MRHIILYFAELYKNAKITNQRMTWPKKEVISTDPQSEMQLESQI